MSPINDYSGSNVDNLPNLPTISLVNSSKVAAINPKDLTSHPNDACDCSNHTCKFMQKIKRNTS